MSDLLVTALKATRRDPKLKGIFNKALAKAQVLTLVRHGNHACPIKGMVSGEIRDYLVCFSNPKIAGHTLKIYSDINGNSIDTAQIKPINTLKLFFSAARAGLAIYLNPKNIPDERIFFNPDEVKAFLLGPWALDLEKVAGSDGRSPFLTRSKRGRSIVDGENTQLPISEIDFDRPFTASQLAEIFGVSENSIIAEIAKLEGDGTLDMSAVSISLDELGNDPPKAGATRYYDPVVAFHIGYQIKGQRGKEFQRWHTRLLSDFCNERRTVESELDQVKGQLEEAGQIIQNLQSELHEKSERIAELETLPNKGQESLSQLAQELLLRDKQVAELRIELEAAGQWLYPESVGAACEAAQARYGARLVFHERVAQSVSEFSLNNDLRAVSEAVKMFKALAECLHPMRFERDNFSEEQFRNETGIPLSMTESKATKRDRAIEDTRTCFYNGRKITFYPHLKRSIQGIQMRLHFQFLTDERKIIICHVGNHLPNAKTKYLS